MDASKARKFGVAADVVPADQLVATAKKLILDGLSAVQPWDNKGFKLPGGLVYSAAGARSSRRPMPFTGVRPSTIIPALAPSRNVSMKACCCPWIQPLRWKAAILPMCLPAPKPKHMVRSLFISMQALNKGARRPADAKPSTINKVGILGGGLHGRWHRLCHGEAGIRWCCWIVIWKPLRKASRIRLASSTRRSSAAIQSQADKEQLLSLIQPTADYADLADCDLVIEAVFEDSNVKKGVTEEAAKHMKRGAIFASNTSTIPISGLAKNFPRQNDFIGIHFFSPVDKMMLTEIIMGKKTGDKALAMAVDYVLAIKKTPIVVNDTRGFFVNRCVLRYMSEAYNMLIEGVPPAMIENVAKMAGMPVGPLALNDETAIDLSHKILHQTIRDMGESR
ncbi:MAG: 3-hydroxyacyl-CoA dehydrogenase family protein [Nitratireductor sp.]